MPLHRVLADHQRLRAVGGCWQRVLAGQMLMVKNLLVGFITPPYPTASVFDAGGIMAKISTLQAAFFQSSETLLAPSQEMKRVFPLRSVKSVSRGDA